MRLLRKKMLMAPFLALALAFLLAGAVSFLPQNASQGPPNPHPTGKELNEMMAITQKVMTVNASLWFI